MTRTWGLYDTEAAEEATAQAPAAHTAVAPVRAFVDDLERARWCRYRVVFDRVPAAVVAGEVGVTVDEVLELAARPEATS